MSIDALSPFRIFSALQLPGTRNFHFSDPSLSWISLSMYGIVSVLTCVQLTPMYLSMWRPMDNLGYHSSGATNLVCLRQYLLLGWSSPSRLGWLAKEPQRSICVYFTGARITIEHQHTQPFIHRFKGSNTDPCACKVNVLLSKLAGVLLGLSSQ